MGEVTEGRRCKCHGELMRRNAGSNGGWRCAVKSRANQRAYDERVRRHDPARKRYKKLWSESRLYAAGSTVAVGFTPAERTAIVNGTANRP